MRFQVWRKKGKSFAAGNVFSFSTGASQKDSAAPSRLLTKSGYNALERRHSQLAAKRRPGPALSLLPRVRRHALDRSSSGAAIERILDFDASRLMFSTKPSGCRFRDSFVSGFPRCRLIDEPRRRSTKNRVDRARNLTNSDNCRTFGSSDDV
jgi:hypothetical protein